MAKNDLFRKDWLDIVFENRNKEYGAYRLRKNSSRTTVISLVAGMFLFSAAFVVPSVVSNLFASNDPGSVDVFVDKIIEPTYFDDDVLIPEEEVIIPEEQTAVVETILTSVDEIEYRSIEAASAEEVIKEPPSVDAFDHANPGAHTIEGVDEGEISTGQAVTDNPDEVVSEEESREGVSLEDEAVYIGVSHKAEPYETMTRFSANFVSKFRTPEIEAGMREIRVIMSFIVEKDGSLTDIKVLRDPGFGASREAIRVLKTMPKWKPAMNKGKAVRSQFTLPITIRVQ